MSREVLFKAKVKNTDKWVEGSIREMMKNHIQAMDFFVNAWMPLPELYREDE